MPAFDHRHVAPSFIICMHTRLHLWMHVCLHIMAPSAARAGSFATSSVTTFIHFYFSFEGKNQQNLHRSQLTLSRHMDTRIDNEGFVQSSRGKLLVLLVNTSVDERVLGNPHLSHLLGCCVAEPKLNPS